MDYLEHRYHQAWEEFTESDDCHSTGIASQDAFRGGWAAAIELLAGQQNRAVPDAFMITSDAHSCLTFEVMQTEAEAVAKEINGVIAPLYALPLQPADDHGAQIQSSQNPELMGSES